MTTDALEMPPQTPVARRSIAFARPYFGAEEEKAAAAAVASGWVVGGPRLAEFEARFAAICGAGHAVGVSSWTAGAFLVLYAWGIGPGDEVIVPSLTFIASVNVIRHAGATPVFVDIDPATLNIDPCDVEARITQRTRAIIAVDQVGLPCNYDAIRKIADAHALLVLADAACSFGSINRGRPVGGYASVACFSLHARKIVTTGEGGVITTNDEAFARRLRCLRHQGMSLSDFERHGASPATFETYPEVGFNFRITDVQAAIGLVQLGRLDDILVRRRTLAARYIELLTGSDWIEPPLVPAGLEHNWQSFQVRVRPDGLLSRNGWIEALFARGIPTRRGVMASHHEPPYQDPGVRLPFTDMAAAQGLQLPLHPGLSLEDVDHICATIKKIGEGL